jgi:hypothetical protein
MFASVKCEQKFPLITVRALTRTGLIIHVPLLIDTGRHAHLRNKDHFSFELFWFRQESFYEMVKAEWEALTYSDSPIDKWQKIIRHLQRFLRG